MGIRLSSPRTAYNTYAVADTGATASVLPWTPAVYALGFSDAEMIQQPPIAVVGGDEVEAWAAPEPIHCQIRVDDGVNAPYLWGPEFVLQPVFIQSDDTLLGIDDFFTVFTVTFSKTELAMHIYWP